MFTVRKNVLTDRSVLWEIYPVGGDQRLASSTDEIQARNLAASLDHVCRDWADLTPENSVDIG